MSFGHIGMLVRQAAGASCVQPIAFGFEASLASQPCRSVNGYRKSGHAPSAGKSGTTAAGLSGIDSEGVSIIQVADAANADYRSHSPCCFGCSSSAIVLAGLFVGSRIGLFSSPVPPNNAWPLAEAPYATILRVAACSA